MIRNNRIATLIYLPLVVVVGLLMVACSSDEPQAEGHTSYLYLCTPGNTQMQEGSMPVYVKGMTRADGDDQSFVPGTGSGKTDEELKEIPRFIPYNTLYPVPINKDYTTIGCFLADNQHDSYNSLAGYFSWLNENQWNTTVGIKEGDFFIFGYMPSNASGSTTIAKRSGSSTWAEGCDMTISGLSTVTPADVCVVVGVLKGDENKDPINKPSIVQQIQQGVYGYRGEETNNYVYLLLDHLYTNVNLELCVEPKYAELRTIKLKQVLMKSTVTSTVDLVVTLVNDAKNPIQSVSMTDSQDQSTVNASIFGGTGENAKIISSDPAHPTSIPGYFAPGRTTQSFDFEFVYDVYDRKGNLVRENCHAINKWSIKSSNVSAGKSFKVKVTIKPTYLYQLSEPDLDNPTIELSD